MKIFATLLTTACLLSMGCQPPGSEQPQPIPTEKAAPVGGPEATLLEGTPPQSRRVGGMKFDFPADWEEKPAASTVLLGEYTVPGSAGPGRLTFSTAGGGTAANLDRWKGQFQRAADDPEPKETQLTVDGKTVSMIELTGTFQDSFGGGGSRKDWALLGVAIPIDADHNYFVKLTGPKETAAARRNEFVKFIESAKAE